MKVLTFSDIELRAPIHYLPSVRGEQANARFPKTREIRLNRPSNSIIVIAPIRELIKTPPVMPAKATFNQARRARRSFP